MSRSSPDSDITPFDSDHVPCETCIQTDRALTRREIVRRSGIKGALLIAAAALGLGAAQKALAGYVYMGHVYRNCHCISPCREDCDYCEYWRNEFGQVQYRNCIFDRHNAPCGGNC